jgi:predicted acylesterase/phospholipase RssA
VSRHEWKIWEAARATSAAMKYFEPIKIAGVEYRDGGLMYNNPIAMLHAEACDVFEGREQVIVSLGVVK